MDALQHFASRQVRQAFAWGIDDCMTLPADWVAEVAGFDPMLDLRGRYDSFASCQRVTGFLTAPLAVIGPRMDRLPVIGVADVSRGDVALVMSAAVGGMHAHGAICLGNGQWMARGPAGLTVLQPAKVLTAWRLGLPQGVSDQ